MIPPALVKPPAMEGTGFLGQAAQDVYHLADDDLYLVGTAEVPLAAYHSDEILRRRQRCRCRYVGYSPSFRREAGSHGKDTRGIFRVHWFDKVEMFVFCAPEDGRGRAPAAAGVGEGVHRRPRDPVPGDRRRRPATSGSARPASTTAEAWLPTQERYREITSTSNCTEFQARRLNVRASLRQRGRAGRHPERDPVRDDPDDRHAAGEPSAGGRVGADSGGAAALPRRTRPQLSPVVSAVEQTGWRPRAGRPRRRRHRSSTTTASLPAEVRDAVRAVADAGVPVVLSTGRSWHSTLPVVEQLGLPTGPVGLLQRGRDRRLPAGADRQGDHLRSAGGDRARWSRTPPAR